ncbi:Synaptotagmin-8, partial [Eschrichtius robustus]|nr:Synaptotagmin-8 [Eschrichtius robustus]
MNKVQPDVDNVEPGPGGPQQWERLQPSVEYDVGSQAVRGPGDVRDFGGAMGEGHETKVHRGTLCPTFEETRSFHYVPGSGRLTVVVLEARGLSPVLAEPYVKVQLVLNQRKWKKKKTSARKGTATPYFNEAFTFLVPFSQIQSVALVLAVWARGPQFRAKPVRKVLLGARASGQPLQHWADMLAHARRPIAQWHRLQPAREVDRALALQPHLRLPLPGS